MNSNVPNKSNHFSWVLAAIAIGLTIVAAAAYVFYPRYQARRWEEEQAFNDSNVSEQQDSSRPEPIVDSPTTENRGRENGGRSTRPADNGKPQDSDEQVATSPDGKNKQPPTAVYIYADEKRAAQEYARLLEQFRMSVKIIRAEDLDDSLVENVDLVIIGADTRQVWDTNWASDIIRNSGIPVLAMGEGGYHLFGELGLQIGEPHGVTGDVTQIRPDSEAIFWDVFRPLPVNGLHDSVSAGGQISIKLDGSIDGVIPIAGESEREGHFPLIVQKPRYLFWGFNGTLDQMTSTGRELFPWACHYAVAMKQHPDRAFTPKSEVDRIRNERGKQ